jgi:hypothetical protein
MDRFPLANIAAVMWAKWVAFEPSLSNGITEVVATSWNCPFGKVPAPKGETQRTQ